MYDALSRGDLIDNLKYDTSLGLSEAKKDTLVAMGSTLLDEGFESAFVAGILGNILHEANVGSFESSNYISNPDQKPDYLKYVDEHFDYREKFSGKNISDVGLQETKKLADKCKATNYVGKFGLGCVQWTGSRNMDLVNDYIDECGEQNYPTKAQCYKVESTLICKEFNGDYSYVYEEWLSNHSHKSDAASEAGSTVCIDYEKPAERYTKAKARAKSAEEIYDVMRGY